MTTIRKATEGDIEWMLLECKKFSDFYNSKIPLLLSDDFARQFLRTLITEQFVAISENEKETTGFIAGVLAAHPINPTIQVLSEVFWWVKDEFRGGRSGSYLLNEFVRFGEEYADWIICTIEAESPINGDALLRRGFRRKEINYLLEIF